MLRLAGPADLGTWVLARTDLDGNQEPEWLVFTKCVNGFYLELWPSDFRKPLASYVDCGI